MTTTAIKKVAEKNGLEMRMFYPGCYNLKIKGTEHVIAMVERSGREMRVKKIDEERWHVINKPSELKMYI